MNSHPIYPAVAAALVAVLAVLAAADEPQQRMLSEIDSQRKELREQIEQFRGAAAVGRPDRSIRLCELHWKLYMLDYDDPRTRIGAAVAMKRVPDEELLSIVFDVIVQREPKDIELQQCKQHMEKLRDRRREAIDEIIWALCSSQDFIKRIEMRS
jgi:hypothetical protein